MFTQLTQCFDVINKLECPDPEVVKRYMKRFAKTIVKVLIGYTDIVKREFSNYVKDERTVDRCNVHICIFIKKIFFTTGMYLDEQHSTVANTTGETVRVNGWRKGAKFA